MSGPASLKLLIVSEMSVPYSIGGGETRYALLTAQLAARGHRVTWLSMHQRGSPGAEDIAGVRHLHAGPRLAMPPVRSLWQKLRYMGTVFLHLLRHRYDLVDCQAYAPLPAAWLACRLRGMPMVASIHDTSAPPAAGCGGDQWLSATDRRLATLVEARLYRLGYDRLLTGAQSVRRDFIERFGVPAARVAVAANGVDVTGLAQIEADPVACDLIFVGRHIPHKHVDDFLEAAARITRARQAQGRPAPTLKVVGGGPLEPAARARAQSLGLAAQLRHWGEIEHHRDVVAHIRSAAILVLPSTREGFGLVLTEALASSTAVVAYDIAAVRETVGPALREILVPAGDVQALTDVITHLLDDPAHRAALVAAGRAHVCAHFDVRDFATRVLAVYTATLDQHRAH